MPEDDNVPSRQSTKGGSSSRTLEVASEPAGVRPTQLSLRTLLPQAGGLQQQERRRKASPDPARIAPSHYAHASACQEPKLLDVILPQASASLTFVGARQQTGLTCSRQADSSCLMTFPTGTGGASAWEGEIYVSAAQYTFCRILLPLVCCALLCLKACPCVLLTLTSTLAGDTNKRFISVLYSSFLAKGPKSHSASLSLEAEGLYIWQGHPAHQHSFRLQGRQSGSTERTMRRSSSVLSRRSTALPDLHLKPFEATELGRCILEDAPAIQDMRGEAAHPTSRCTGLGEDASLSLLSASGTCWILPTSTPEGLRSHRARALHLEKCCRPPGMVRQHT